MIANLVTLLRETWSAYFYRSSAGAELDLLLEGPRQRLAFEIKHTLSPKITKGFRSAYADVKAARGYFMMPFGEEYFLDRNIKALSLGDLVRQAMRGELFA